MFFEHFLSIFVGFNDILCKFVTCNQIEFGPMKLKCMILSLLASFSLAVASQPVQQQPEWEWYIGEVVNDVFVGRNYFEYYYTPSAADMERQRSQGEVTYFLNSPDGLNSKKVRNMIDRLMASYDDIKAVNDWQVTNTTYWKEFRYEKNKFRFSVKRKALDDGTYYVSVTETAGYYKSLGKSTKGNTKTSKAESAKQNASTEKPAKRSTHSRRAITEQDVEQAELDETDDSIDITAVEEATAPVVSEKERRRAAREREQAAAQEQRLAKRRAQEQQREEAKKQKEAEKQKKAEEKKKKEEEKRLAQEEKRRAREQAQLERKQAAQEREQAAREKAAEKKQAAAPKPIESNYNYDDIALWLSEKYDFTQTAAGDNSCTMYSTAVKDVEMAKLAIKNALKGSNARMAVPWRVNSDTQDIETGYTVDDHVLVFAIGKDADERITLTVTEVSNDQFELFKQQNVSH